MAIINIQTAPPAGQAAVTSQIQNSFSTLPSLIYIQTTDTYATVTATGYLTSYKQEGNSFSNNQMALVYTTDEGPVWLKVAITYSNASVLSTIVSLIQISSPGDVVLPTIANNIIVSTDTVGTLANTTATAVNRGSIQAGLSGDAGTLISYSATASKGSLIVAAVANTNNDNVTISNALHGQASVYSIPDSGAATANLIVSKLTGTQHITVGAFQVDAGVISSGISTGGTAGGFIAYPATTTQGSLRLTPVGNVGNFAASISNVVGLGQATVYTLPDPGAATANILVSASAGGQLIAGGLTVSTGNLAVSAGTITASGSITSGTSLVSGSVAGGTAGSLVLFSPTAANGSLRMLAVGNAGNFATTISDLSTVGQAQVLTIPDVGAATGQFVVKTAAFVNGNLIQASGTAGLTVDSGVATANVQLKTEVKAVRSADIGGGGATVVVTAAGCVSTSVITANIVSSSNVVSVAKVTPGTGDFTIVFSGDPGAACVINYIMYIAQQ